jgi:outer membrane receptor protein involved in Fe transport
MNISSRISHLTRAAGLSLALVASALAQGVVPAAPAPSSASQPRKPPTVVATNGGSTDEAAGDVKVMSPFVVETSSDDIGYYAENTLAGSRLSTKVSDLSASITVVTRQQMLDTASVDSNDIFLYEANTEGTKNFTSFTFGDQGNIVDNNQRAATSTNRFRGVGAADRAHNYYYSISALPFDVYNTESVEINRGPNSLLFGLGSAAGIVNQSSSNANLRNQSGEVTLRYGNFDSYRGSFRFNQPVIKDRLAIFGAALYDSRGFQRKPSYDISRRGYVAMKLAATRTTTINASFEHYSANSRIPNTITPQDEITPWIQAGKPSWNPVTMTYTVNGTSTKLTDVAQLANVPGLLIARSNNAPWMYYDNGKPVLWMQAGLTPTSVTGSYQTTLPQPAMSASQITKLSASTLPLFRAVGISNRAIYDWEEINASSGSAVGRDANIYNVELDQKLLSNLFFRAGWYRESFHSDTFSITNQAINIDPNTTLVDGTTNPFFGRPYFTNGGNTAESMLSTTNDNYRVSLAYVLDFTKNRGWTRWFGTHRIFGFGDRRELDSKNLVYSEGVTDNHVWQNSAARFASAPGQIVAGSNIFSRWYMGGNDGVVSHDPGYVAWGKYSIPLRNATFSNGAYNWVNEPATLDRLLVQNSSATQQTTDSLTLGMQSSFLDDRIVPTLGLRRDRNNSRATRTFPINASTGLVDLSTGALDNFNAPQVIYGTTRTAGVVVKPLKWMSFSYGQSRNFAPASLRVDIVGRPLPLPTGKGRDMGVRFELLDGKFILGLNYYEASANNARGTSADSFMFRVSRFETDFIAWATGVAQLRLGPGATTSAVTQEVANITQLPVGFVPPALSTIASSSTVNSHGYELQLIFNPRRNWNIKATAGLQNTVYSHVAPEFDTYVTPRMPIWLAAKDTAGNLFWTNPNVPDLGNPQSFWTRNVAAPMTLTKATEGKRTQGQRPWSGSVISTYRFTEGPLKGYDLGGSIRATDKAIIGYLGAAPGSDGIIRDLDANKPVYDDPKPAFDFWASRSFALPEIFGRHVRTKLQANVRNAFERGNWLQAVAVNPDGAVAAYRIVDPREWSLTATFSF